MLSTGLNDFVIAMVGASASFIGLLFVAISFVLNEEDVSRKTLITRRILAESSYASLVNIFFIGLVALIPDTTIGYVLIVMAWLGITTNLHYIKVIGREKTQMQNWFILVFSMIIYGLEFALGIYVLVRGHDRQINNYVFMTLILFLFSMALTRAWELTGIRPTKTSKKSD